MKTFIIKLSILILGLFITSYVKTSAQINSTSSQINHSNSTNKKNLLRIDSEFFNLKNQKAVAELYSNLLKLNSKKQNWKTKQVDNNDKSLSNIIWKNYRFYDNIEGDTDYGTTYKIIKEAIVKTNSIENEDKIKIGETLFLPVLPVRPEIKENYNQDEVQYFDYQTQNIRASVKNKQYFNNYIFDYTSSELNIEKAKGSSQVLTEIENTNEFNQLIDNTFSSLDIQTRIKYFSIIQELDDSTEEEILKIDLLDNDKSITEVSNNLFNHLNFSKRTIEKVTSIDEKFIRPYYILDIFKEPEINCSHGQKVKSVVDIILNELDASQFCSKVKTVPIDFFTDKDYAKKKFEEFINKNRPSKRIYLEKILKRILKLKKRNCTGFCVPKNYLSYLIQSQLFDKPDVLSMSFSYNTINSILGRYYKSLKYSNLLAAVQNDKMQIETYIDDMGELGDPKIEPLHSFYMDNAIKSSILVGGRYTNNTVRCFYSKTGENVSFLGQGVWNLEENCTPTEYGSSYATPQIATYLWLVKSYYRSLGIKLTPLEAKLILMLSSEIEDFYIGKFGTAGIPNLNKALIGKFGYVEVNHEIKNILKTSKIKETNQFIEYKELGRLKKLYLSNRGTDNFSGLSFLNNKLIIFDPNKMKWKQINDIKRINLEFKVGEEEIITIKSIPDLKKYKVNQLAIFK